MPDDEFERILAEAVEADIAASDAFDRMEELRSIRREKWARARDVGMALGMDHMALIGRFYDDIDRAKAARERQDGE